MSDEIRPTSACILVPFGAYAGKPLRDLPDAYLAVLTDSESLAWRYAAEKWPAFLRAASREWRRRARGAIDTSRLEECGMCSTVVDDVVPQSKHFCEVVVCRRCFPRHACDGGEGQR